MFPDVAPTGAGSPAFGFRGRSPQPSCAFKLSLDHDAVLELDIGGIVSTFWRRTLSDSDILDCATNTDYSKPIKLQMGGGGGNGRGWGAAHVALTHRSRLLTHSLVAVTCTL